MIIGLLLHQLCILKEFHDYTSISCPTILMEILLFVSDNLGMVAKLKTVASSRPQQYLSKIKHILMLFASKTYLSVWYPSAWSYIMQSHVLILLQNGNSNTNMYFYHFYCQSLYSAVTYVTHPLKKGFPTFYYLRSVIVECNIMTK